MDAYSRDQCPTDDGHAARVLAILNDLIRKQSALTSAARIQAATEGSQIAKAALKWAKQQVWLLFYIMINSGDQSSASKPCMDFDSSCWDEECRGSVTVLTGMAEDKL